jgi:predicted ribosome quality control (RQC) complex YloA/Tae2 family protein
VLVALVNAKTGTVTSIDVAKWDFQVKGVLTADTLLTLVTKQAPAEEVSESIEARIKHLEQLIQQLRDVLNQLEKELSELKKWLGQQQ